MALFGSQASSAAHFPVSLACSLTSFFSGSSQVLCHAGCSFKGASEELMGTGGGPSQLTASLGSLSYPFCLWQLDSWTDMGMHS